MTKDIPFKAIEVAARELFADMMERQNPSLSTKEFYVMWDAAHPDHQDYFTQIARRVMGAATPLMSGDDA